MTSKKILFVGGGTKTECDVNKKTGYCRAHSCQTTKTRILSSKWGWRPKLNSWGTVYSKVTEYHCTVGKEIRAEVATPCGDLNGRLEGNLILLKSESEPDANVSSLDIPDES